MKQFLALVKIYYKTINERRLLMAILLSFHLFIALFFFNSANRILWFDIALIVFTTAMFFIFENRQYITTLDMMLRPKVSRKFNLIIAKYFAMVLFVLIFWIVLSSVYLLMSYIKLSDFSLYEVLLLQLLFLKPLVLLSIIFLFNTLKPNRLPLVLSSSLFLYSFVHFKGLIMKYPYIKYIVKFLPNFHLINYEIIGSTVLNMVSTSYIMIAILLGVTLYISESERWQ